MSTVLWQFFDGEGHDRCTLEPDAEGHRLAGTALFSHDGVSYDIRYTVIADAEWHTRVVAAHVQGDGRERRLSLRADGAGAWWMSDTELPELAGCLDVDLAFTLATSTLPIRRLGLDVGGDAQIEVAYVGFPEDELTRATQSYARLGVDLYRYTSSDGKESELTVDDAGLVIDYPGYREAVATA
jgi:hypothetical protein